MIFCPSTRSAAMPVRSRLRQGPWAPAGRLTAFLRWYVVLVVFIAGACASVPASECEEPNEGSGQPVFSPTERIELFNGLDLSGFYTWQSDTQRNDPRDVYSVKDGMLRISGEGLGYLATRSMYRNYRLVVEYKWGKKTGNRGRVRNSGILLHGSGEDGNYKRLWMTAIECQLAQGCEGDMIIIQGNDRSGNVPAATLTADTVLGPDGNTRWSPDGKKTVCSGHQLWWSNHDPEFKEPLDGRGRWDVASPKGQWTRVECLCDEDRIAIRVNGETVNAAYDVVPGFGKILLQNEGHEILFRMIELHPLLREERHDRTNLH